MIRFDSPIRGILSAVEGSVLLRISSITEIDSSKVTLKPNLSYPFLTIKKEATSRMRKKNTGTIMFMTYSRGLLFMSICQREREREREIMYFNTGNTKYSS